MNGESRVPYRHTRDTYARAFCFGPSLRFIGVSFRREGVVALLGHEEVL